MFHTYENESFKNMNNENTVSTTTSTAKESNNLIQSTRLNLESNTPFMFNFK